MHMKPTHVDGHNPKTRMPGKHSFNMLMHTCEDDTPATGFAVEHAPNIPGHTAKGIYSTQHVAQLLERQRATRTPP